MGQVLRGDSGRHLPQGHQTQPRHPMDHKGCAQAQRDAWPDICRKEEPRPGQGPQVPPDHRRLSSRCLEEAQHPAAAPLSLRHATHVCTFKINALFMVSKKKKKKKKKTLFLGAKKKKKKKKKS